MNSRSQNREFNPSGVGLKNGNFIGLPYTEESARVVLLSVPWDVTVSYGAGTARGPEAILEASVQLDLYDPDIENSWQLGIFMRQADGHIQDRGALLREKSVAYIDFLERGGSVDEDAGMAQRLEEINASGIFLNDWVFEQSKALIEAGKLVGIVGGDHSVPLGYIRALAGFYESFGILQIDAHLDLRERYEGFEFSHASIFNHVLKEKAVSKLVQVGIRDYCHEEMQLVQKEEDRISLFTDQDLSENRFNGVSWNVQCSTIIEPLPDLVYVSFDVDGLNPGLCPNTGTPVPGGLEFSEVMFLLKRIVESGRTIIGFDVCETGDHAWDANVAARIIYKLSNLAGRSQGFI